MKPYKSKFEENRSDFFDSHELQMLDEFKLLENHEELKSNMKELISGKRTVQEILEMYHDMIEMELEHTMENSR